MALTYQLEKEKVGTDHLKKEPQINRLVSFTHHLPQDAKITAGFYSPGKMVCIKLFSAVLQVRLYTVNFVVYDISSLPCIQMTKIYFSS